jgi:peptidoglycan hydrolase-like protein with peptidoglycan-binding domain
VTGIVMFDSAWNDQFPPGAAAYAAYVDGGVGSQPNYAYIVSAFPHAHHLSIALFPDKDADALDVESGAAQAADIPAWFARQRARGIARPVIYAGAYTMQAAVVPLLGALPGARSSVRLWGAHYGLGEHICGPRSCGQVSIDLDGTQWTDSAMGRLLDQSILAAGFFGTPPAPSPVPAWQEAMMKALPLVTEGDKDTQAVRTVQGLLCARGHAVTVDGSFGPATLAALVAFQRARGLHVDGECGPATWPPLMGVS